MEYKDNKAVIDPLKLIAKTKEQKNDYEMTITLSVSKYEYAQQNNIKILKKNGEFILQVVKQTLEKDRESIILLNIYGNNEENDSAKKCVVCISNSPNCFLLPCRHLILCTDCASKTISEFNSGKNSCPLCRTGN